MRNFCKYIVLLSLSTLLFSCTTNSTTSFHKDETQSSTTDLDFTQFLALSKAFAPNSEAAFADTVEKLKKIPTDWISFDVAATKMFGEDKVDFSTPSDTLDLMKKIFIKTNYLEKDLSGISLKYQNLNAKEMELLKYFFSTQNFGFSYPNAQLTKFNGNQLTIDTNKLVSEDITKFFNDTFAKSDVKTNEVQIRAISKIFEINYTNILKFEKKIKSIKGNHPWISKKDDYTVLINYKLSDFYSEKYQSANHDKEVIITTE